SSGRSGVRRFTSTFQKNSLFIGFSPYLSYFGITFVLLIPLVLSVLKNCCNAPGSSDIVPLMTSFLTMLTANLTSELWLTAYGFCRRLHVSKNSKFASSNFALTIVRSTSSPPGTWVSVGAHCTRVLDPNICTYGHKTCPIDRSVERRVGKVC